MGESAGRSRVPAFGTTIKDGAFWNFSVDGRILAARPGGARCRTVTLFTAD
jgi:hypothetical protein